MARVEVITNHDKLEFQDEINKIIQNSKFGIFDIKFNAHESYPEEADIGSPERFYSAMIIIKDEKEKGEIMVECDSSSEYQSKFECMGCYEKITDYVEECNQGGETTKVEKEKIGRKELVIRTKINSLLEIYNDLGTMKWAGADESWDTAIEAVRKDLFNKIKKSLRKTDKIDLEFPATIYYTNK